MSLIRDRGYCLDCSASRSLRREEVDGFELLCCMACGRVVKRKELRVYPQSDQGKKRLAEEAKKVDPKLVHDWAAKMHAAIEQAGDK